MSVYEVVRGLPEISVVRDRSRALAMLDAILSPEWDSRYYSFDSGWSPTEEMASMRDGSGNDYFVVFSAAGAYAQASDHESPMTPYHVSPPSPWPGLFDSVPAVFRSCLEEPALSDHNGLPTATAVLWRKQDDHVWNCGNVVVPDEDMEDADGAERLFDLLVDGRPEAYRQFAEEYYEIDVALDAVRHVYALRPLSQEVVSALNPDVLLGDLAADVAQIGYPSSIAAE